jgi:hypothetical protein
VLERVIPKGAEADRLPSRHRQGLSRPARLNWPLTSSHSVRQHQGKLVLWTLSQSCVDLAGIATSIRPASFLVQEDIHGTRNESVRGKSEWEKGKHNRVEWKATSSLHLTYAYPRSKRPVNLGQANPSTRLEVLHVKIMRQMEWHR